MSARIQIFGASVAFAILYVLASTALPKEVDIQRFSSGIYDMDVRRIVAAWTTSKAAQRTTIHPLYKIAIAPIGERLRFGDDSREAGLAATRIITILGMAIYVALTGWLTLQLSNERSWAGIAAAILCGVSFSSLLLATIPESASLSGLTTLTPLLYLGGRIGRKFSWRESLVWALLFVFCAAFTITQIVHWLIALGVRFALGLRNGGIHPSVRNFAPKIVLALLLGATLTGAAIELQSAVYPGTRSLRDANPLEVEKQYMRLHALQNQPTHHVTRLFKHFAVHNFVAPYPGYSDFITSRDVLRYWSLSLENTELRDWEPEQLLLLALLTLLFVQAARGVKLWDVRFIAPSLCVLSQWCLHLLYGREYIMYSSNWHGAVVAIVIASASSVTNTSSRALRSLYVVGCIAILSNSLLVLNRTYEEFAAGLSRNVRDSRGALLPEAERREVLSR